MAGAVSRYQALYLRN